MKKIITFQNIKLLFTVIYATILGACVEFMCRYLFFSYTRKNIELPTVVKWLLIEQVPAPYFPRDYTYVLTVLIPVLLLLCLFLWSKINPRISNIVDFAIVICNMIVILFFITYMCVFLYCIYIFSMPELLDPPTYSSWSSTCIKYTFATIFLGVVLFIFFIIKKSMMPK